MVIKVHTYKSLNFTKNMTYFKTVIIRFKHCGDIKMTAIIIKTKYEKVVFNTL